jgi:predicted Ser/Thr protein kinase
MLPDASPTRPRPRVGRYLITGRIGRGGMGVVYRGLDEALEREVAVKTLISEGSFDDDSLKRFKIEAKAAAALQHTNIVTVYELGEDRGVSFIAMEMLPGADLETLLRSGEGLSLSEKLDVVVQVCRGLAHAHERGIVHRDIKPSNIRLLDDGTAKIMDFGIAKLGGTHLTKTGMMVGTVYYMSPEQVRGLPLDGRSDVFSIGVILYELLAGQRPFRGEGATQVLYKIVNEEPEVPDLTALGELGPRLQAILSRALAKDRDARYPSAAALAGDLAAVAEEAKRTESPAPDGELAAAQRALREGRDEEGITHLQQIVAEHPTSLAARRMLRAARREQKKRLEAAPAGGDDYSELEATFQPAPTRREPGTEVQPTVAIAEATRLATSAGGVRPRTWLAVAGALLLVAAVAGGVLVWRSGALRPPAPLRIPVRSQPMGAAVLVDGKDSGIVTNGELVLVPPLPQQVALTFRKAGHRDETRTVRLPLPAADVVSVTLQAEASAVSVRSRPPGASVTVDGEPVAGTTPLELKLDTKAAHKITLALDGYERRELSVAAGESPSDLEVALEKLPPPGEVTVVSAYPLDVFWRGRPLARGALSPRVQVPGGRQVLTLVSAPLFLRDDVTVEVAAGGEVSVEAPGTGRISVRAQPDNCKIFFDGAFVDYPPILDRPVAAGRHTVAFVWPDGGRKEETVEVSRGAPTFVVGRKE